MDPTELLDGHQVAASVYERVRSCLASFGPFEVRTSKSQIAFRRKHGFAYLWLPGQYLMHPDAEVVHPSARHWMHHLELRGPDEIDDEVVEWLREAVERAS